MSSFSTLRRFRAKEELEEVREIEGRLLLFSLFVPPPPLCLLFFESLPPSQLFLNPHSLHIPLLSLFLLSSSPDHFFAIPQSSFVLPPLPFLPDRFFDGCLTFESTLLGEESGGFSLSTFLLFASEECLFDERAFVVVGSVRGRKIGLVGSE